MAKNKNKIKSLLRHSAGFGLRTSSLFQLIIHSVIGSILLVILKTFISYLIQIYCIKIVIYFHFQWISQRFL